MNDYKTAPAYSPLWKPLYTLIKEFIQTKPWTLFENKDVFIVQNPKDSQMYLCCVMGDGGEEFGLNAFRGAQGMRNFSKIVSREDDGAPDKNLMYEFDMLSFSLSPRDYMEKQDLSVLKKLMLSFPGGSWPLIRSYMPHYYPWFLTEPEIEALTLCLDQTLVLAEKGDDALEEIRNVKPGEILVRCKENNSWVSRKIHVGFPAKEEIPDVQLDDISKQRLLKLPATGLSEEIDLFHLPGRITDREPPYFPLVLAGINEQEFAHNYGLFLPFADYFQEACESLVKSFLTRGTKPVKVLLKNDSPFADVFERVGKDAGIQCERRDSLPNLSDFIATMDESMEDGGFPDDLTWEK
jgi:hypothetical protein